nr:RNA-directed DNA polymerase, eukaryota [Tanacetum cinerariifolium]
MYTHSRPPKKRKKSNDDIASQSASLGKLSRKGKLVSYGKYGSVGHNRKGCRGQGGGSSQAGARKVSGQAAGLRKVSGQATGARNVSANFEKGDTCAAETRDIMQKAKIKWAVEGDGNSKFFHGMVNQKRTNLAVKGIMIDGVWVDEPRRVKNEFRDYFATRFQDPGICQGKINFLFPKRLCLEQAADLELPITRDEIRNAVWSCGENKSPGPDGFSFEFFCKFWYVVGSDFCMAVEWFLDYASFPIGCNSSFIALIPKSLEPKVVSDFWPICLIGSVYKVIIKILQSRLLSVISDLISGVQTAFLPNRQILDGPFIINELLARCHHKKQ